MLIFLLVLSLGLILTFAYLIFSRKYRSKQGIIIAILMVLSSVFVGLAVNILYNKFFVQPVKYVLQIDNEPVYNENTKANLQTTVNSTTSESGNLTSYNYINDDKDSKYQDTKNSDNKIPKYQYTENSDKLYASESNSLIAKEDNGKWGFVDNNGKTVIPFIYDYAEDFSEGLAAVRQNYSWGYIDPSGKTIIPFEYAGAWDFINGLAPVYKDNLWGFINKDGNLIIEYQYTNLSLSENKYYDEKGKQIVY